VGVGLLRERYLEGLRPAAVVANQVRRLARRAGRLGELADGLIPGRRPGLVHAHVRGQALRQRRPRGRRLGRQVAEAGPRGDDGRRGDGHGRQQHQPGEDA